jgi:hypothetical protein
MGLDIGARTLSNNLSGRNNRLTANGNDIEWMAVGSTIGWGAIDAKDADGETPGGTPYKAGQKVLTCGTYMVPLTGGDNKGEFAPYEQGGADGAGVQSPDGGFLDQDIIQGEFNTDHVGLIVGGTVWRERLKLVAGLTLANIRSLFPRLRLTPPQSGF